MSLIESGDDGLDAISLIAIDFQTKSYLIQSFEKKLRQYYLNI
jgi:hypothetical protein